MFLRKLLFLMPFFAGLLVYERSFSLPKQELYQIKIYYLEDQRQEQVVESYLQNAFLPAMHRLGFDNIGVFKPISQDTANVRMIYVLVPYKTVQQFVALPELLERDKQYTTDGHEYLNAPYNKVPYQRIESILLKAFSHMPVLQLPDFNDNMESKENRVYELRSYEGPTEKLYRNKVHMFNEGGEVEIFRRLGFNPVFFGDVLIGSRTPNLMYMTSFKDMVSHDAHWQSFRTDPAWKDLSSKEFYKHNVSKSNITLLKATKYSDI